MKYHFRIQKEKNRGYFAQCLEIEGCVTQGETLTQLRKNMREAIHLAISEPEGSKHLAPLPGTRVYSSKNIEEVIPDLPVALAFAVRYFRLKNKLSQKEAAHRLGFSNVFSYQRLESPRCNPSLKTLLKIKELFPEISFDEGIKVA